MTRAAAAGEIQSLRSASGMSARLAGVSMIVGRTALTRILRALSSSARLCVKAAIPAFEAA